MTDALLLRQHLTSVILRSQQRKFLKQFTLYLIGLIALTLSAKIAIPMIPVPVTLQSFTVLLIGMIYGWRLGCTTIVSYLLLGVMGLPVFAPVAGGLLGPTSGYLMGFLPAAFISGLLVEYGWGQYRLSVGLAAIVGMAVIYFYGIFWLSKFVGLENAVTTGLKPFIMICVLKVIILALLVPALWKPTRD